jgi:alginate O-acetyltransferase complex protein AlgI
MLFSTIQFFVFLAVALAGFYLSPQPWRKWVLLAASYFFYMSWNPKFILLIMALTAIDYTAGLWLAQVRPGRRRAVLAVSLSANLAFLGFFKYYNFAANNFALLLGRPGNSFWLDIVLPLGISFHTFQSMSYVIDVYRGEQEPIGNLADYALFISFFPQLVAGPIVRAREFFRDFYGWRAPSPEDVQRGILLTTLGLTKKMVFADRFAQVCDAYFANVTASPGLLAAWSGAFAFAMQVYFDFSGYSDMAIGMARLLGFHFPENFRRPYLSDSVSEYWRRWHMTLSRWLRDYLYIPMGGNRGGALKTYRNLVATMLLGGLWHGAHWNFVLWGGYQGLLLSAERLVWRKPPRYNPRSPFYPLRVLVTFGVTCIGYVIFRAPSLKDTGWVLGQMFSPALGSFLIPNWLMWLVCACGLLAALEEAWGWFDRVSRARVPAYACALTVLLLCLELFSVLDISIPFVYFQF